MANSQTGICASFKTWFKTLKMPFTSPSPSFKLANTVPSAVDKKR
jgi:hypothetical protein